MLIDGPTLIMSAVASGFLIWIAISNLQKGEISTLTGPVVRRADNPSMFWFAITLSLALAVFFLALGFATVGKMAGWWEFTL